MLDSQKHNYIYIYIYIYIYTHTHTAELVNAKQLHVSALYVGHYQVVVTIQYICVGTLGDEISSYSGGWHGLSDHHGLV